MRQTGNATRPYRPVFRLPHGLKVFSYPTNLRAISEMRFPEAPDDQFYPMILG